MFMYGFDAVISSVGSILSILNIPRNSLLYRRIFSSNTVFGYDMQVYAINSDFLFSVEVFIYS